MAYTYDPNGQMLTVQRDQGTTPEVHSQYTYDLAGRLTRLQHTYGDGSGGNIDTYNLTYDADDRLTVFSSSADGTAIYSYDANGQLLMTTGSAANPAGEDYDYDPEGNRIVDDDVTGNDSDIGPDNRLLQSGDVSYTYDGNGNRLTSLNITTRNYSVKGGSGGMGAYDYRNRLTSITTTGPTPTDGSEPAQDTAIYTYDVENRRIGREVIDQADDSAPTLEEAYGYDQGQLSLVIDATAAGGNTTGPSEPVTFTLAERIMETPGEADHPLADVNVQTGAVTWLLGDEQGSIRDSVTNGSNYHVDFDSYGNVIGTNQPARFGYTGAQQDGESGLVYMSARYYDPSTGTFISQDPTGFGSGDTNLYRYTGNSPTNRTDPTGTRSIFDFLLDPFGIIPKKTFIGSLLYGASSVLDSSLKGTEYGFEGNWNGVDTSAFTSGYYLSGAAPIIENTPIHSIGLDLGWINGGVSYDPGTGLRTLSFGIDGAEVQQSMSVSGHIDTMVGAHFGFGIGGVASVGVSAMYDTDHWQNSSVSVNGSLYGAYAGASETAGGQFTGDFGYGVPAQYAYGQSAGLGWTINSDGRLHFAGASVEAGGYIASPPTRSPLYTFDAPGLDVADYGGEWTYSVLAGPSTDFDPSWPAARVASAARLAAAQYNATYATAAAVAGGTVAGVMGGFAMMTGLSTYAGSITSAGLGWAFGDGGYGKLRRRPVEHAANAGHSTGDPADGAIL